jgi:hypothetical protein
MRAVKIYNSVSDIYLADQNGLPAITDSYSPMQNLESWIVVNHLAICNGNILIGIFFQQMW